MDSFIRNSISGNKKELHCHETYDSKLENMLPFLLDMDLRTVRKGVSIIIYTNHWKFIFKAILRALKLKL